MVCRPLVTVIPIATELAKMVQELTVMPVVYYIINPRGVIRTDTHREVPVAVVNEPGEGTV